MWAGFNSGAEIQMTLAEAQSASHPGDCEADVRALMTLPKIKRQLDRIGHAAMVKELKEYGAWDEAELADVEMTRVRFLWCAACSIVEEQYQKRSK